VGRKIVAIQRLLGHPDHLGSLRPVHRARTWETRETIAPTNSMMYGNVLQEKKVHAPRNHSRRWPIYCWILFYEYIHFITINMHILRSLPGNPQIHSEPIS
jgi:hypothetical protein